MENRISSRFDDVEQEKIFIWSENALKERVEIYGRYKIYIEIYGFDIFYRIDNTGFVILREIMSARRGISAHCLASLCG